MLDLKFNKSGQNEFCTIIMLLVVINFAVFGK